MITPIQWAQLAAYAMQFQNTAEWCFHDEKSMNNIPSLL